LLHVSQNGSLRAEELIGPKMLIGLKMLKRCADKRRRLSAIVIAADRQFLVTRGRARMADVASAMTVRSAAHLQSLNAHTPQPRHTRCVRAVQI
jgi:hypothetical protein